MVWFYRDGKWDVKSVEVKLSIPLWSDFISDTDVHSILNDSWLSIPLWSDFIGIVREGVVLHCYNFQSHYGLILSLKSINTMICILPFNPTMVWFYLSMPSQSSSSSKKAFNPTMVWFYQPELKKVYSKVLQTFNPTMVWFYQINTNNLLISMGSLSIPLWSDFI